MGVIRDGASRPVNFLPVRDTCCALLCFGAAIRCFFEQTYHPRELLILFDSDDVATREYIGTLADERIRSIEVSGSPRRTLGALRNLAVSEARGQYICQWDDDDWYHPDRLTVQFSALRASGRTACVLSRWTCLDVESRRAYISPHRAWEGSLLVERARMVAYPDLARGEDTVAIEALAKQQQLHMLDRPELYVYTFHGCNTWDRSHWAYVLGKSTVVPWPDSQEIVHGTSSDAIAPQELPMREHLAPTRYWFDQAQIRGREPLQTSYFRFADAPVRMRVVGSCAQ